MTTHARRRALIAPISSSVIAALALSLAVHGALAAPSRTPDQQLAAALKTTRAASRTALSSISPASARGAQKAATELALAIKGIDAASKAAANAVGALETSSVRKAVQQGPALVRNARSDVVGGRYATAREKLRRVDALTSAALNTFGVPLEKDFPAFVTARKNVIYTGAPMRCPKKGDFCGDHTGLSVLVGRDIVEVVIGPASRRTANAGEPRGVPSTSRGLPITYKGPAFLVEANGRYATRHCALKSGLITCRLHSPMPADRVFMIAVGPPLAKGTQLLVKVRSADGDRSYAVGVVP
jgi:hypothetical protein